MSVPKEWLASLRADSKGPVALPAADRGKEWFEHVEAEGDWTDYTLTGGLRISPDAASQLAAFTISGPVLDEGWTVWTLMLGAQVTANLPSDANMDGVETLPYSVYMAKVGDSPEMLFGGVFTLRGIV